ncbi:sodium- and chloride-dependent neutral and basic amino acid transporter B(0+)-like [Haematobia irritans]|uniref:sodium- and chloride-dependent neutral and basic amino acid transporter B(0+)-like n=1 Tax=Haematobia irritans TaxID=7368 RepID=UPI003F4F8A73
MTYESSYENGRSPYLPDSKRGSWLNSNDFVYACIGLMFHVDLLTRTFLSALESGVFIFIPVYLVTAAIYIIPLMLLKSYMGQFSSSGFISAFRLSPMFKGIGYISLLTNICVLAYQSIFAMVPLLYMLASINPTLPWSCDGFKTWARNLTDNERTTICNFTYNASIIEWKDEDTNVTFTYISYIGHHIPSVLYFKYMFHDAELFTYGDNEFSMSWQLIICALLVWTIMTVIVFKFFQTETIGLIIRYSLWIVLGLMAFFILAFSFLPGGANVYSYMFQLPKEHIINMFAAIPVLGLSALGPGWGMIISLSSFNKFNTNIIKSSCLIVFGQFAVTFGLDLLAKLSEAFFYEKADGDYFIGADSFWTIYLSSASVIEHMPWANLWSILFYFMLFLSSMIVMVLQLFSILTSFFDEFAIFREKRTDITVGLLFLLIALSIFFSSNYGLTHFSTIAIDTLITQSAIYLMLIVIVLWIYGRERFQRDFQFMTEYRFSTWSINILRFVAPIGLILAIIEGFIISFYEHESVPIAFDLLAIVFIVIPWLSIPGFAIYQMSQSMGTMKTRFFRCCRPTDWFPIEGEYKEKYEAAIGSVDITHTLSEVKDEA